MSRKPIRPRETAKRDVEEAIDYYAREAGADVATGLIDALQAAYRFVGEHPAAGPPRYANELGLPGLRSRLLKGYPYIVFYVERDDHIDVWRVLHAHRDIPVWMREPGGR
ncbi:MAG: type II toxin-antitoxin system RelE/ParE family toxin [Reyranella sp.]|nr:type II toxin-antitoxin system RelE/ParE family toxin [Reyranella sp.]